MSRRTREAPTGTVYLIHFEGRLKHAGHYLGYSDDLTAAWSSTGPVGAQG